MDTRPSRLGWTLCVTTALLLASWTPALAQEAERPIDPTRFADAIAAFEAEDEASFPPEGAIVATGSSSIRRWTTITEDLAPLTVIPRGFGGSTMADLLHYVDELVIQYRPRAVVIYEGDNDTGSYFVPPEKIVSQFEEIVAKIHAELPQTRIYVLSVKPSTLRREYWDAAQETNRLLRGVVASNHRVNYIDVATPFLDENGEVMPDIFIEDGLHLNEKGTEIWAATIKGALIAGGEAMHERSTNE